MASLFTDAILTIDRKRRVLYANEAALRLCGLPAGEVLGQEVETVFRLEQGEADKSFHVMRLQLPKTGLLTLRTVVNEVTYLVNIFRVDQAEQSRELCDDACGLVIVTPELPESPQAEPDTAVYTRILGFLTLRIAHDFNNSLTSIIGNSQLVEEFIEGLSKGKESQPSEAAGRMLDVIRDVVRKSLEMGEFVRSLQDYARQKPVSDEALDINTAIRDTLTIAKRILGSKIKTEFLPGHNVPPIVFERSLADQIVFGLLVNCKENMPRGGRITIETEPALLDVEFADLHPGSRPGSFIRLTFSDNGAGMDKEALSHVFDPSFSGKKIDRQAGLGIATVYAIVKQSGGYIEIESWPGKGSRYEVYLPVGGPAPPAPAPASESTAPGHEHVAGRPTSSPAAGALDHPPLVLVAEDEPDVQRFIERNLTRAGYRTLITGRGDTALEEYKRLVGGGDRPSLVIADLGLPGMDGRTLFRKIKEFDESALVLLTSGYQIDAEEGTGRTEEGYEFIQKPFESSSLLKRVETILHAG